MKHIQINDDNEVIEGEVEATFQCKECSTSCKVFLTEKAYDRILYPNTCLYNWPVNAGQKRTGRKKVDFKLIGINQTTSKG